MDYEQLQLGFLIVGRLPCLCLCPVRRDDDIAEVSRMAGRADEGAARVVREGQHVSGALDTKEAGVQLLESIIASHGEVPAEWARG